MALLALGGGCNQDPYTLVVVEGGIPDLSTPEAGCIVTNGGIEACDNADNDCDGLSDEDFDLLSDPDNCGQCGNRCQKPGLLTVCEGGLCKNVGCAPGFYDLNDDLSDGCEYVCTPTGEELCDGKDNDCNGQIDETFDLQTDVAHCGDCATACQLAHAIPRCTEGECQVQSCEAGFIDKDGEHATGCEEPCVRTEGGNEICDGIDNDCNGVVDDPGGTPLDFDSDPHHCGGCNVACQIPHANVACQNKVCVLVSCVDPWLNTDGSATNGCECEPTGAERCDGVDNDCNGAIDEGLDDLGPCGETRGECEAGQLKCQGGREFCDKTGKKDREPEICDGKDNDCNGVPDDNLPHYGFCGTNEGECIAGTRTCSGGQLTCVPEQGDEPERCDGKDNDCNGVIDDVSGVGDACGSSVGECIAGSRICNVTTGQLVCDKQQGPTPEMCADSKDSDCDSNNDQSGCIFAASGRERKLDDLSSSAGANNSTQLTVAGSGNRVFAAWLDRRNGRGDVFGNFSSDGGRTWGSADVGIATESASKAEPQAAYGGPRSGGLRAYVAYSRAASGNRRDVYVRRNPDGSWKSATRVDSQDRDSLFLRLAVHPGATTSAADTVVVCWEEIRVSGAVRPNVYCARSQDSGASFDSKVRVNQTADAAILPQVAIDDQYVYVAWNQGSAVHVARANHTAGSLSFGDEATISGANPARSPQLATNGAGTVIAVWEDLPNEAPIDLYATNSSNRGATWSAAARIDTMVINGDSTRASLALDQGSGGRAYVAWQDTSRGLPDIYANYSDNGGLSWLPVPKTVSAASPGTSTSRTPMIALPSSGTEVFVTWADQRNASGVGADVFFGFSLDAGDTWNIPDYRLNESTPMGVAEVRSPFVWATPGRAAVVWVDHRVQSGGAWVNGANGDIYGSYVQ